MGNLSKNNRRYGWRPDLPDQRDHMYSAGHIRRSLPPMVDLRSQCPADIYDQGQLGSCTANAIGCAIDFNRIKQGMAPYMPSRLFIYYNERDMEGTIPSDSGAMIRDGIKSVNVLGACPEADWPYIEGNFTIKPPEIAYTHGLEHQTLAYQRVLQNLNELKGCLAAGFPIVFGFSLYESFEESEVATTGVVQMPKQNEQCLGGHAVLMVGYDDNTQRFLVRNSWGRNWGMGGYFTLPYSYVTSNDLADDFWTIRLVE